jgi:predicted secreted Zn-dependent protease
MKTFASSLSAIALLVVLSGFAQAQEEDRINEIHAYGYMVYGAGACDLEFDLDKFGELVGEVAVSTGLDEKAMTEALEFGSTAAETDATADLAAFCEQLPALIAESPMASE